MATITFPDEPEVKDEPTLESDTPAPHPICGVYLMGEIGAAHHFVQKRLFCKWRITYGSAWKKKAGTDEGVTQASSPSGLEGVIWAHPIDMHLETKSLQGWPSVSLEVWQEDSYGRKELLSYGVCPLPSIPGTHNLTCPTWQPKGGLRENLTSMFVGGGPQLVNKDLLRDAGQWFKMRSTHAMGTVHITISIVLQGFGRFNMEC